MYSNSLRAGRPGRAGRSGKRRSRACIPVFSSIERTTMPGGGCRYSSVIFVTFSRKWGSGLWTQPRTLWGRRSTWARMRWTVLQLISRAIPRRTTSLRRSSIVRCARPSRKFTGSHAKAMTSRRTMGPCFGLCPGRGRSHRAARPNLRNRPRQRSTVLGWAPHLLEMSSALPPSSHERMIRARKASRCVLVAARTRRQSSLRCSSLRTIRTGRRPGPTASHPQCGPSHALGRLSQETVRLLEGDRLHLSDNVLELPVVGDPLRTELRLLLAEPDRLGLATDPQRPLVVGPVKRRRVPHAAAGGLPTGHEPSDEAAGTNVAKPPQGLLEGLVDHSSSTITARSPHVNHNLQY